MSGPSTDLVDGIAAQLAVTVDGVSYDPTGAYPTDTTGIFDEVMPDGDSVPDRCVTLTTYPLGDDPTLSDSTVGLQVRVRSAGEDPRDAKDLDDAIFDALQAIAPVTLGGIRIVNFTRTSGVSLGQDERKRWHRSSNYTLDIWRPSTYRT